MIREVLNSVQYGTIATIALLLFFLTFVAIGLRTYFTDQRDASDQAELPLSDGIRRDS